MSQATAPAAAIDDASLFQSSISLIAATNDDDNDVDNPNNGNVEGGLIDGNVILARLNELRMWQQSQQQLLISDQVNERERLRLEKQKLYELFGLSMASEPDETDETIDDIIDTNDGEDEKMPAAKKLMTNESIIIHSPPIHSNLNKIVKNTTIRRTTSNADASAAAAMTCENIVKRPYLKRGEGLTKTFKITPDAFRLDNLPKYKFARRRASAHVQQQPKHSRHRQRQTNESKTAAITTTQHPTTSGEGHQSNVKRNQIFHVNQSGALKLKPKSRINCVSNKDEPQQLLVTDSTSKGKS